MGWRYPADDRHVPPGGEFLSKVLDNGQPRSLPHSGLDYSHYEGKPIYAIGPGTVVKQGTNATSGWGYYTYIDHGDIGDGRHAYSYYAHKAQKGPAVGTKLNGGEQIGTIGRTGSGITGAHLHWGVAVCTPAQFASTVFPMGSAARALLVEPEGFVAARLAGPKQRVVGAVEARRRAAPNRNAAYDGNANLAPGTVVSPAGWVTGESVDGNSVWFVIGGLYSHSSGFTDAGIHDLADLNVYPNQRVVRTDIANGRIRRDATTTSEQLGVLEPGQKVEVTQFKRGQAVTEAGATSDVWFRVGAGYAWAGSFTRATTDGLTEIVNPAPPSQEWREVRPDNGVNVRAYPTSSAALVKSLDRGTKITVEKYANGDVVTQNGVTTGVWYVVDGGYAWAGGFTSQSVEGLGVVEVTPPQSQYPSTPFTFSPDFPSITSRVVAADWSNFENEYSVADPALRKGFPADPRAVIPHQWGAPGQFTLSSVLNTFQGRHPNDADKVSPHFTIGLNSAGTVEIIQNVPLTARAYHAGSGGNDFIGIEVDPLMTPEIVSALKRLLEAIWEKYGHPLEIVYHHEVAATSCGQYTEPYEAQFTPSSEPDPGSDPDPSEMPEWFKTWLASSHAVQGTVTFE